MDIRNNILSKKLLENSINLKEKDNILIEVMGEEGLELGEELTKISKEMKANPLLKITKHEDLKYFLMNASEQEIIEYSKKDYEQMKKMNAYIGISAPTSDHMLEGISQEKINFYNKYYTAKVHLEQRVKHTKWCILRYPNEYFANKNNMTLEEFKDYYYKVCNVDYEKMKYAMEPLKQLMNKTDKVHIIAPNTDLKFSIKNIPAEKYYGTFNIPDGEVATCPVKESVQGHITYNTKTKYNDIIFNDIRFEFKDGKIIKAEARDKTKELNEILDTDEGARYIGEFAFGLNPYIDNVMCDTLFDEKIHGSFHFTPGMALEESDNGNRSAIHWDIVKILRKEFGGGEVYFDDVLIMKDGKFVLDELKQLNSENFKNS